MFDDFILRTLYQQFDVPADRLVSNPAVMQQFTTTYTAKTRHCVEPTELALYVLNLRKRGRLPRLKRNYYGRYVAREQIAF